MKPKFTEGAIVVVVSSTSAYTSYQGVVTEARTPGMWDTSRSYTYRVKIFDPFKKKDVFRTFPSWGIIPLKDALKNRNIRIINDESHQYIDKPVQETPVPSTTGVTLSLDDAKKLYQLGGEAKKIALKLYSEKQLTEVKLPTTLSELKKSCNDSIVQVYTFEPEIINQYHIFIDLMAFRNEWLRLIGKNSNFYYPTYIVAKAQGQEPEVVFNYDNQNYFNHLLSFPNREIAQKFVDTFKESINKAYRFCC